MGVAACPGRRRAGRVRRAPRPRAAGDGVALPAAHGLPASAAGRRDRSDRRLGEAGAQQAARNGWQGSAAASVRVLLLGADPVWIAWSERLTAAGWTVEHWSGMTAGTLPADADAVLLTPWLAPARDAAAWAASTWPAAAVWVVVTGPTAAMQRGLLCAGAAGTLARDPSAWALLRLRASATGPPRSPPGVTRPTPAPGTRRGPCRQTPPASPSVAGEARGGTAVPVAGAEQTGDPSAAGGGRGPATSRTAWGLPFGGRAAPGDPIPVSTGPGRSAVGRVWPRLTRRGLAWLLRAQAGSAAATRTGGRPGRLDPWWAWPPRAEPGPGGTLLGVVATPGVDPRPLLEEWAARRLLRVRAQPLLPDARPQVRGTGGGDRGVRDAVDPLCPTDGEVPCLWVPDARPPREGVPDPRLHVAAQRCVAVAVAATPDPEGLRAASAVLAHLASGMGGTRGAADRLALWLVEGCGRVASDGELSGALGVPCRTVPGRTGSSRPAAAHGGGGVPSGTPERDQRGLSRPRPPVD